MKIIIRAPFRFLLITSLYLLGILGIIASGGGGGGNSESSIDTDSSPSITTTLDVQNRVTETIPVSGGTVSTTGQDGTVYTLTIEPDSLNTDIQITVTPVSSISGMGLEKGFIAAVDLLPDGQKFLKPVVLTVELASPLNGNYLPVGIHTFDNNSDFTFITAQGVGNTYTLEIGHFSTAGLVRMTPDDVPQYMVEKFYGLVGIERTILGLSSCYDYKLELLALKTAEINVLEDCCLSGLANGENPISPPRQCTGYWVGTEPTACTHADQLGDAARTNLRDAYLYLTQLAIDQCSEAKEKEAFACIAHELRYSALTSDINEELCGIKTHCGIAALEIVPEFLELAPGQSKQVVSIARDIKGVELPDREVIWEDGDTSIAKISNILSKNPDVSGNNPGITSITLHDVIGYIGLCPQPISYLGATVHVSNSFVTSVESLTVPEGGSNSFQVKLAYPPEVGVQAAISRASGDSDINVASGAVLTFNTSNWDVFQTVVLSANEDDGDVIDGTASIEIVDQRPVPIPGEPIVATKSVTAIELDNDEPLMFITPDPLCVEKGKTANLSVVGNEFVDLDAIVWSSSDESVAVIDQTGNMSAGGNGPARIVADMIVDGEIVASAFSTVRVKDHCVTIKSPDYCIKLPTSTAFSPVKDTATLVAEVETALEGHSLTWSSNGIVFVVPSGPFTGNATSASTGNAIINLNVDNVVTQYEAAPLPMTVAAFPNDYQTSLLNLSGNNDAALLTHDRRILSHNQMAAYVQAEEARCNVNLPDDVTAEYVDVNRTGQIIGVDYNTTDNNVAQWGFVFDTVACTVDVLHAPIETPIVPPNIPSDIEYAGSFVLTGTVPYAINDDGRIVGGVSWSVTNVDDLGDPIPGIYGGYTLELGFVYDLDTGVFDFPNLPDNYDPYIEGELVHNGFTDINNNGIALGWIQGIVEYLYDTNIPELPNGVAIPAANAYSLNDLDRVIGFDWLLSNSEVYNPQPQLPDGSVITNKTFLTINNEDDILSNSFANGFFVMYACPFSVENDIAANWFANKTDLYGYESLEVSCDGMDNDLDGFIDAPLVAPFTDKQSGVCAGTVKTCMGEDGWVNDYSEISGYQFPETTCDNQDNDCDGISDEGCEVIN